MFFQLYCAKTKVFSDKGDILGEGEVPAEPMTIKVRQETYPPICRSKAQNLLVNLLMSNAILELSSSHLDVSAASRRLFGKGDTSPDL